MRCPSCGAQLESAMRFCPACGYKPTLLERMEEGGSVAGFTAVNRPKPYRKKLTGQPDGSDVSSAAAALLGALGLAEQQQTLLSTAAADSLAEQDYPAALFYALHCADCCGFLQKNVPAADFAAQLDRTAAALGLPALPQSSADIPERGWFALAKLALQRCPYAIVGLDEGEQDFFFFAVPHSASGALQLALQQLLAACGKRASAVTDWTRLRLD